jgi:molybdopterin-guanine dinucleotide biosynthesis protein A
MSSANVLGIILAGGQSLRMGQEKSLMLLGGWSVLAHVIMRFRPQVSQLVLNANADPARFAAFDLETIADAAEFSGCGPLAGILAGLHRASHSGFTHLASVPCDAPFLPSDLVPRLFLEAGGDRIGVAQSERGLEPLFAVWPAGMAGLLHGMVRNGMRSARQAILSLPHSALTFASGASGADGFLNLNRPEDVKRAELRITQV